ncbi:hypothetical protein O6P43_002728 [Quillaja saponaria]|uniref:Uncharacterized protein n=1 Tax=Quillaja saponaria TaxID=32244 RepID=A0AAD7QD67_QUISA|nr:hypothetical protein O6P43_002728 [Quillaja saponaria]
MWTPIKEVLIELLIELITSDNCKIDDGTLTGGYLDFIEKNINARLPNCNIAIPDIELKDNNEPSNNNDKIKVDSGVIFIKEKLNCND